MPPGDLGIDDAEQRAIGDLADRGEVSHRVEGQAVGHEGEGGEGGHADQPQHGAVLVALGHGIGAEDAAGAAAVFHHHILAQCRGKAFRDQPAEQIHRAAGREGHHEAHRAAAGDGLGMGRQGEQGGGG